MRIRRKYGWKKQSPDHRDFKIQQLALVKPLAPLLPPEANLQEWCSEVEDQKNIGACTGNSFAALLEYNENKYPVKGRKYFDMSRLFIYYCERAIEGTVNEDSGAQLRDGAKALSIYGCCPESEWPYDVNKFAVKPSKKCYKDALPNVIHSYYSLDGHTPEETLINLKTSIASGNPFVLGFTVYESFESDEVANTGIMPIPKAGEQILGGHAVFAVGFSDTTQDFLIKNSWGKKWGLKGYFRMPYKVISDPNMASDMWTIVKNI